MAPKFASEILVEAPNFASKNLGEKYPKFCPLNFRFDPKIGIFPQLLRLVITEVTKFFLLFGELGWTLPQILPLVITEVTKFFLLFGELGWTLPQILPLNLMSGPSPPPDLLIWKYPLG